MIASSLLPRDYQNPFFVVRRPVRRHSSEWLEPPLLSVPRPRLDWEIEYVPRYRLRLTTDPALLAQIQPVTQRLIDFFDLPDDWDPYGSEPVSKNAVVFAVVCFAEWCRATDLGLPAPAMVPTPTGGVKFEWNRNGYDLEIEIEDEDEVTFFGCSAADPEGESGEEGSLWQDPGCLLKWLQRVSTPPGS